MTIYYCRDPFQHTTLVYTCMSRYRFMFLQHSTITFLPPESYHQRKKKCSVSSTQSQRHRISWVGRYSKGSWSPTPGLPKIQTISTSFLQALLELQQLWVVTTFLIACSPSQNLSLTATWSSSETAPCPSLRSCCHHQKAELSTAPPLPSWGTAAAMRPPLSSSALGRPGDLHRSLCAMLSRALHNFVAPLWILLIVFCPSYIGGTQTCTVFLCHLQNLAVPLVKTTHDCGTYSCIYMHKHRTSSLLNTCTILNQYVCHLLNRRFKNIKLLKYIIHSLKSKKNYD